MAKSSEPRKEPAPRRRRTPAHTPPAPTRGEPAPTRPAGAKHAGHPEHDEIARRAYEIYLARGGQDGADVEDWLRAEREVGERRRAS